MQTRQQQMVKLCDITGKNFWPRRSSSMILCTSMRKSNLSGLGFPTKIENRFAKKIRRKFRIFWHFFGSRKFSRNFDSYYFVKKCEIFAIHEMQKLRKKIIRKFCEKTVHFKDSLLSWLAGFGWTYVDGQKLRKIENSNSLHQTFTKI